MRRAIGIDIGGTHVKAVLCDERGAKLADARAATGDETNAWRDASLSIVAGLEKNHGPADAIGVSCPGIARPDGGGISWMIGRMEGVVDFDFTAHFRRGHPVPVLNDGLAALLGEAWCGAARGLRDAVLLTLGTGVGGAILADGRLLKGHLGRSGHLGHISVDADGPPDICNTPGSIESFIGDYSLAQRSDQAFSSTEALVAAAERGDAEAIAVWRQSVRRLAAGIASIINVVDPQRIIIGGGIAAAGPALFDLLADQLAQWEWRPFGTGVEIAPAQLGEWAGAFGAARNALLGGNA